MKTKTKNKQAGFTLIEFIVTLVIAAIAAAMVYSFMGTMMTKSSDPITRLKNASRLHQVMENIVADFKRLNALNLRYKWQASTDYSVGSVVLPSTSTGYYYTCVTAGSSGTTAPSHTTGTVGMWKVGGIIWKSSGTPVENIVWKPTQTYVAGASPSIMIPIKNDGHYYRCTTAHTTTATEPATWIGSNYYSVGIIIQPTSYNGHFYRCTAAGTSGATEPTWPTTAGGTVTSGVTWQEVWSETGTILARSNTATSSNNDVLNDNIYNYLTTTPTRYGTGYTVVTTETKFIKFSSAGVEQDATGTDEKNILKVTIQDSTTGERLTQLFTIR